MGIPAIRESIVLHRQGLATLKEPNYLLLSQILAVVCSGLRWFAWFSLPIVPNSGGDLWWFALICGGLWSFAVVCGGLRWFAVVCLIVIPTDIYIYRVFPKSRKASHGNVCGRPLTGV